MSPFAKTPSPITLSDGYSASSTVIIGPSNWLLTLTRIVLFGIMQLHDPKLKELRRAAQELRTYGWQTEEARGNFVKTLERQGPTLVCTLASPVQIERWPGGEQLCCDVQRFLVELGHRTLVHGSWR